MLRSLLNSARGKSAFHITGQVEPDDAAAVMALQRGRDSYAVPLVVHFAPPPRVQVPEEPDDANIRPERCCIYCALPLYAVPSAPRIRCPRCFRHLPVRDFQLDGSVRQTQVLSAGRIAVGPEAIILAQLVACNVEIAGRVVGDVRASYVCIVRASARITGAIRCRHLELEPGAHLDGPLELSRTPSWETRRP